MAVGNCTASQLRTDPQNCGTCGHDCTQLANVIDFLVQCTSGVCDVTGACTGGFGHCTARADDGCETDLTTPQHCGTCTRVCSGSKSFCSQDQFGNLVCSGACGAITPDQCGNICVDELSDPNHCGSCTTVCPSGTNASALCDNGFCSTQCDSGFHSCNGQCVSDSSTLHCATDCSPCPTPLNGSATCDPFFGCGIQCNAGFVPSGASCVRTGDMSLLPCDCSGLLPPACPLSHTCVGTNCCQENAATGSCTAGSCTPSAT